MINVHNTVHHPDSGEVGLLNFVIFSLKVKIDKNNSDEWKNFLGEIRHLIDPEFNFDSFFTVILLFPPYHLQIFILHLFRWCFLVKTRQYFLLQTHLLVIYSVKTQQCFPIQGRLCFPIQAHQNFSV